ncbi:nebulette isoform X10 [Xiphophorus maculatus]|uniref:nebulette isoform X10 n=1 Tax=Xiphophorus maculatus TaxID=8083 RepID=UPI000C6C9393|nr:nebulette isoform X10 [Xiphophorus maculatus]
MPSSKLSCAATYVQQFHRLPSRLYVSYSNEENSNLLLWTEPVQKSYKEKFNREKGRSDYSGMKTLPEVEHAMEVAKKQSHISYRKGREELHRYNPAPDRPDIISAANAAKLASDVAYKRSAKKPAYSDESVLDRTDILQAKQASRLASQVKYKESFERHLKGQRPRYNPMDCVSFRHTQAAAALASQVKYKTNQNQRPEGSLDLPNLLQLEHVLHASKLQSNLEYKKKYEETKAHYHIAVDTAEQQHHRENAVLHSQVKYKEEYEKNKGRSLMEFGETQSYKVSKEAQKMQSEREYRRDFEEQVKGKALLEADQTPGFLTARNASSLLSEKEYRKDLEQEVKGRGLSGLGLEETPELLRVKKAGQILNQKEYRRDLETEIMGKGMELSADVLEIQRATRASQIQSQISYKQTEQLRENSYGTLTDTPELLHASYLKDVYSQKKYKDEAEQLKGRYHLVSKTPEMERVRANQKHISSLQYCWDAKLMRGLTASAAETPEIVLARENAKKISDVQYREEVGHGTPVKDTPEMERVRRNQENISSVKYRQSTKACSMGVTPELERVKQNQQNISSVRYQRGLQELRGRSCSELDTPEYRRVRRTQDSVSMAKYHEDFERTRGRGFTPGLDDPSMERYQRANQMMGEAAYAKGIHPQAVEMDRRPGGIIVDLKVWRTDPGSIFDFDPVEDNIQSKSLRRMSERAGRRLSSQLSQQSASSVTSDLWDCSGSSTPAPVLPGAYHHHHHHQGVQQQQFHHGYMHQTSMSSVRSVTSPPHSATSRVYRALYDYAAQDHDEVSFRDGDVIVNAQPIDEGWMYGTVQRTGKSGMLPANYVECCN